MADAKQGNWFKNHKVLTVIGALILLAAIGSAVGGSGDSTQTNTVSTTATEQKAEVKPVTAEEPQVPAEYKSALTKAETYSKTMSMSKQGIYDQLTSEYGEKFTAEAAQYAVDNLKADYNANALAKAKTYQNTMSMSPTAIHDQLTSPAGEKFTVAEADYAIAHLNE